MKKRKILSFIFALLILFSSLIFFTQRYLEKKLSSFSSNTVKITSVYFPKIGIKIKNIKFHPVETPYTIILKNFYIRPSILSLFRQDNLAFAFTGPGEIETNSKKREIDISGSVSGNFKKGDLKFEKTKVYLEKLGKLEISGSVENWGKEKTLLKLKLDYISLENLLDFFNIESSAKGKIKGDLLLTIIKKENIEKMDFVLNFPELFIENKQNMFNGQIIGNTSLLTKKTEITKGEINSAGGGKIIFEGLVENQDFNFKFTSKGITVEEILDFLPAKFKEKIGVKKAQGQISMDNFSIQKDKKNFLFSGYLTLNNSSFIVKETDITDFNLFVNSDDTSFNCKSLKYNNIVMNDIIGVIKGNNSYKGEFSFLFYNGKGECNFTLLNLFQNPEIFTEFKLKEISISSLFNSLNPQIYVSGIMNLKGYAKLNKTDKEIEVVFDTSKKKGEKQFLNFAAVKALLHFGASSLITSARKTNYSYKKLAGKITLKNGYLTIEGLAGEKGENQYLVRSGYFGPRINILVNKKTNTIKLEDFRKRIRNAVSSQ